MWGRLLRNGCCYNVRENRNSFVFMIKQSSFKVCSTLREDRPFVKHTTAQPFRTLNLFLENINIHRSYMHTGGQSEKEKERYRDVHLSPDVSSERLSWRMPPLTAVKTRPGCFPSCSCLIRRALMNFWESLIQDLLNHLHPPPLRSNPSLPSDLHPALPLVSFRSFSFHFEVKTVPGCEEGGASLFYSKTTSLTPESSWWASCQTAGPSAPLISLCDSSCCCICSRITVWLSRQSLSLSSVSVRRSSSTATVWSTSGSC